MEFANKFQNINAQIEGDLLELNSNDNTNTEDVDTIERVIL